MSKSLYLPTGPYRTPGAVAEPVRFTVTHETLMASADRPSARWTCWTPPARGGVGTGSGAGAGIWHRGSPQVVQVHLLPAAHHAGLSLHVLRGGRRATAGKREQVTTVVHTDPTDPTGAAVDSCGRAAVDRARLATKEAKGGPTTTTTTTTTSVDVLTAVCGPSGQRRSSTCRRDLRGCASKKQKKKSG